MARVTFAACGLMLLILASCERDSPVTPVSGGLRMSPSFPVANLATTNATVSSLGGLAGYPGHIAKAINASGRAVGLALGGGPPDFPVNLAETYDPAAQVFLAFNPPGVPPDFAADALAINDGGLITGFGVLSSRSRTYAGSGNWLPQIDAGFNQFGGYANNAGEVVGWTFLDANNSTPAHPTLWVPNAGTYTATDLGLFNGEAIEPRGLAPNLSGANRIIVGRNSFKAFIWMNGSWSELPPPPNSNGNCAWANGVSDGGIVVGGDSCLNGPAIWVSGQYRSLLPECQLAYGSAAGGGEARGIATTTAGRTLIVGTCIDQPAVWYDDGQGGYICELLPLLAGDTEGDAYDVNASGQIVGRSANADAPRAVLWTFTIPSSGGRPPNAVHGGGYVGSEGVPVAFDGSGSSDPDEDALTYDWDFGDGSPHGTGATPSHTYADNGPYTVTLTVNDGTGNTDAASTLAMIGNALPQVNAGSPSTLQSGDVLSFSGSFTDAGTLDTPWATSITWGDGTAATTGSNATQSAVAASHTYYVTGSLTLQLTVTDKDAGVGMASRSITVNPRNVAFAVTPDPIPLGAKKVMQIDVTILSTSAFDASLISPASLRLGNGVDPDALAPQKKNGSYAFTVRDVNRDGLRDFVVSIDKSDPNLGLVAPTTNLVLRANAPSAAGTIVIRSVATVNVVP